MGHNLPSERISFRDRGNTFTLDGVERASDHSGFVAALDAVEYRVKAHWPGRAPLVDLLQQVYEYLERCDGSDQLTRDSLLNQIDEMRVLEEPHKR